MAARNIPEINAGSMADIAFLLLIFFLVTTTMDVDTGITRKLPPPVLDDEPIDIKQRNIFKVLVNKSDRLLIEDKPGNLQNLKNQAKEFIMNPYDKEELPEKRMEVIDFLGEVWISKGVISLKNDRGTSYDMYIKVQDELTKIFQELRDEMSLRHFGVKYVNLVDDRKRDAIRKAIPMAISEAEPENIGGN